jgi:hypothetical protein
VWADHVARYATDSDEWKGAGVPLSEHEQRILAELEQSLTKDDPRFVRNVRATNVYSVSGRRVRWGIAGFVVGLAVLLIFFSIEHLARPRGCCLDVRLTRRD